MRKPSPIRKSAEDILNVELTQDEAIELKYFVTHPSIKKVMARLEFEAIEAFMALPMSERSTDHGKDMLLKVDALRSLWMQLQWLVQYATAEKSKGDTE